MVIRECGYVPAFGSSFIQVFVGDRQLRTGFGGHVLAGKKPWLQQGAVNLKDTVSLFPLNLKNPINSQVCTESLATIGLLIP